MVDSVKNYGLAGLKANVELGKQGPQIIGSDSSVVSLKDKDGNAIVAAVAVGTDATHAVQKSQLTEITDPKLQYKKTTVTYNGGNVAIGTAAANTYIHSVTVEKTSNWTSHNATTDITVGDVGDVDRLFADWDPDTQTTDQTDYKYTASTQLNAYVTQGGASAGTAVVTVLYSGTIS